MTFQNYLLASDYDRTMTDYNSNIPQANLDAVAEFQAGGGVFTIATGRSWPMFQTLYSQMDITAPIILYNGGAIYDPATDCVEVLRPMNKEAIGVALEIHALYPHLYMEFQGVHHHYCFGQNPLRVAYLNKFKGALKFDTMDGVYEDCLNVAFFAPDWAPASTSAPGNSPEEIAMFDHIEEIIGKTYGHLTVPVRSMPRMMEMMMAGTGKGVAARELANKLGKTKLICAGDAPNDLTMLEEADWAFITGDCQASMNDRGYTQVVNCGDGAIAAVVDCLKGEQTL